MDAHVVTGPFAERQLRALLAQPEYHRVFRLLHFPQNVHHFTHLLIHVTDLGVVLGQALAQPLRVHEVGWHG